MKRKLRIFSHLAIICLSVCMFAFGVYAASTVSVTTSGTVSFTAQNVEATVSRKLFGFDPDKSTVVTTAGKQTGEFVQQINSTTTPEGANYEVEALKNTEQIFFIDGHQDVVMEFKITNNSQDKDLFVKLIDNETRESNNVRKIAESLGGEILVEPGITRQFCIYLEVIDGNVSGQAYYNYTVQLNNKSDAVELDETMVKIDNQDGWRIIGFVDGFDKTKLTNIIIPHTIAGNTISHIGYDSYCNVFNGLTGLKNVMIREGLKTIGCDFQNCTSLEYVCIPSSVESVVNSFNGCTALKSIAVMSEYISLGVIFEGCPNIQAMTLSDGCDINVGWLYGEDDVIQFTNKKVNYLGTMEDWIQFIETEDTARMNPLYGGGDLFFNGVELITLSLSDSSYMSYYTFAYCNSLTSVVLEDDFSWVGSTYGLFEECKNITTITIKNTSSDPWNNNGCFYCPNLKIVNFAGTMEQWQAFMFPECAFEPDESSGNSVAEHITIRCSNGNLKYFDESDIDSHWLQVA